jgi:arylsulfatase A-like enzyme
VSRRASGWTGAQGAALACGVSRGERGARFLRPARLLASLLAVCLLAGCSGAGDRPPTTRTLVWLVIDTLRADALGAYGNAARGEGDVAPSPHLDRLASEGFLFERAYAAAPWTVPSVVTQLSGRHPFDHGANRLLEPLPERLLTLPQVLSRQGWRSVGVTTNFVTLGRYGFDRGFERFDDSLALGHEGSYGPQAVDRLLELSDALGGPEQRRFLWLLLFEPHFRYEAHAGLRFGRGFGTRRAEGPYAGPLRGNEPLAELRAALAGGRLSGEDLEFLRALYQSEAAAADQAFGRLRSGLEQRGLWDEAWVLASADHGEELGEQDWLGHTVRLSEALVRVPLLLRGPRSAGLSPRRIAVPVSQVDLFATALEFAGVPAEARPAVESRSLWPLLIGSGPEPRRWLYLFSRFDPVLAAGVASTQSAHLWGVVDGRGLTKWVVDRGPAAPGEPAVRARWFDLSAAPGAEREQPWTPAQVETAWRLRGLLPEPLGERSGSEPVPLDAR